LTLSIEQSTKKQKSFYSGKQKEHTLKIQILIERETKKIICLIYDTGKVDDFKILKNSQIKSVKNCD